MTTLSRLEIHTQRLLKICKRKEVRTDYIRRAHGSFENVVFLACMVFHIRKGRNSFLYLFFFKIKFSLVFIYIKGLFIPYNKSVFILNLNTVAAVSCRLLRLAAVCCLLGLGRRKTWNGVYFALISVCVF